MDRKCQPAPPSLAPRSGATTTPLELLTRLMEQDRARLVRLAQRRSRTLEDAEDAVQEAFLAAYKHLDQFEGRAQLSSWLTRIVINAAADRMRHHLAHPSVALGEDDEEGPVLQLPAPDLSPEEGCYRNERRTMLWHWLDELPTTWRHTLRLREIEGLSTRETARELGVAEGTVKSHLFRAHRQLRRHVAA